MGKPIDKLGFWKERIIKAVKEHYSVYITSENDWKRINEAHKVIIEKEIKQGESVLDAGCGYGRMSVYFDNYHGIDFSPDFIEKAKGKYPDKTFSVENLKALSFKDKSFDWGIMVSIKRMVQDNLGELEWKKMEKEMKRVCKKVLILEYETPEPYEIL